MRDPKEARDLFITQNLPKRFKVVKSVPAVAEASEPLDALPAPAQPQKPFFMHDNERDDAFCSIDFWIRKNTDKKPLLIVGPSGSGKTALIQQYSTNYEVYHDQDLSDFLSSSSLRVKPIGVIDCIESLDAKEREFFKKNIHNLNRRIILTSEDAFLEPTKTWKKFCTYVDLKAPSKTFLKEVYTAKKLCYTGEPCFPIYDMSSGFRDTFSDPLKCTRQMLLGHKTPELLSDISYLNILLQSNSIQCTSSINDLSKAYEKYSFVDQVDHVLDAQSLWHLTELITQTSPKIQQTMPWTFQWPRSSAHSKEPKYLYC
jgi:energy-coupling factor transporter ATP-binding protein EcfA2